MCRFLVGLGLLLVLVACSQAAELEIETMAAPAAASEPMPATAVPGSLTVNSSIPLGAINPLVYGTNYGPWTAVPAKMLDAYQTSGLTFLRFPGGNWGDTNTIQTNEVDWLMFLADMINAEVSISVNLLEGTPEQALELMAYVLDEKAYPIQYWSIGNEPNLFAPNRGHHEWNTAYYTEKWREFALVMKEAYPDIILIGPDVSQYTAVDDDNPKDDQGRDWMREFLRANGDLVDMIAIHRYPFPQSRVNPNPSIEDLRANSQEWDHIIPHLRQVIQEETGRDLPVAVMEVNSNWSGTSGGEATPDSFYNAIWWADSLGRIIQQDVDIVAHFAIAHEKGWGLFTNTSARPSYYVYQLYQQFGEEKVYSDSGIEGVSIFAATREDGALTLIIVNLNPETIAAPLQLAGSFSGEAEVWRFDAAHNAEQLDTLSIKTNDELSLPGQSVTLLILPTGSINE